MFITGHRQAELDKAAAESERTSAEEAGKQTSTVEQQVEIFFAVSLAATDTPEGEINRTEHKCVHDRYPPKKNEKTQAFQ